jgi:Tfp pilus assembly protein PilF
VTTELKRPLDPEVQVLLEEVARDPRSHLLRVPRAVVPLEFEQPVSTRAAFLSSAEKRLLEVHRAEVAELLREAAVLALFAHPSASATLHHSLTVDRELRLADPVQWHQRGREQLWVSPDEIRREDAYTLLAACVNATSQSTASATRLATASLRLVPRNETRVLLALAFHQTEQIASALHILRAVVTTPASQLTTSCVWENIGLCEWDFGRPEASHSAYRKAASTLEQRSMPIINWFVLALHLQDRSSALEAAKLLGELVSENHPSVNEFVHINRERARTGSWMPSDGSKRLSASIESHLPSAARRVVHAAF